MPVATQFSVMLENKPGALARICSELAAKAVNIQAIMTSEERGKDAVRLVVNHPAAARKVFDANSLRFSEEEVWALRLTDRPGALGRATRKLAENKVNIQYAYGTIEKGSDKALVIMAVSDLKKAAKLLK